MKGNYSEIHQKLIELCKSNDRKAQYEIYNLYSGAMYNIGLRMMNNVEEAEDMLQETFVEAFNRLASFRFESSFGAWLKRIMVNKCINTLKKRKPEFVFSEEAVGKKIIEGEELDQNKINVEAINRAIKKLPDGYRTIFSLYLLEGYDHNEISNILDISVSTSKSQFLRAKKKIKELIKIESYEKRSSGALYN